MSGVESSSEPRTDGDGRQDENLKHADGVVRDGWWKLWSKPLRRRETMVTLAAGLRCVERRQWQDTQESAKYVIC